MVKASLFGRMGITTKVSSDTENVMVRASEPTKMEVITRETTKRINPQGKEFTGGRMEKAMKVSGRTAFSTGRASRSCQTGLYSTVCGTWGCQKVLGSVSILMEVSMMATGLTVSHMEWARRRCQMGPHTTVGGSKAKLAATASRFYQMEQFLKASGKNPSSSRVNVSSLTDRSLMENGSTENPKATV